MIYFNKHILAPCLALGALLFSNPAWADATVPITGNGSFNIDYSLFVPFDGSIGPITLSATSAWTVTNFTSTSLDLAITMSNTTVLQNGYTKANILSFGFNGNPTVAGTFINPGFVFDSISSPGNLPSIDNSIDVCVWSGNGCPGGPINDGLTSQSADTVLLHLTYSSTETLTLNTFGLKWQTTGTSYEFTGCLRGSDQCNPTPTPEPGSMLLMFGGLGLMLAGYRRYIN
ncbi:MAG: cistern family PEP-CTERM protein [Alphaproteobacteria bacterium]|nr:cistern family PEP-CTERM protein [Alphaproteobacteria bacterium]